MKKIILILMLVVLAGQIPTQAQRHVKRISAWGLHYGTSEQGKFYEITYLNYLTDRLVLRAGGLREFGNRKGEYSAFTGRVFLSPQLFKVGELAYVHLLLGVAAAYERTNEKAAGEITEIDKSQQFTYGPQVGVEVDVYVSNRISLVASATKGHQYNDPLIDEWPGYMGIGLRYHFR